ncbi:MAG: right-handed parallel beta-helix repeat-containing protein [Gammaproteobacteria bacterium]|nr:right-handed parallel beta-helix repeat-containing protein [Gammaproteobacteria bacterium]
MRASALLLIGLAVAACSDGGDAPTGTVLVAMVDNSYSPREVRVPIGGSIVFHNAGRNPHNAVAVGGAWSTERSFGRLDMLAGDLTEVVFPEAGAFPYYCTYHATPDGREGMVGAVLVGDEAVYTPLVDDRRKLHAVAEPSGVTRRVPQDYPDIQTAVDAAFPGDLVLIDAGVYHEEVFVSTPSLTIRGVDRNAVVMDGQFQFGNAFMIVADAVAVENMSSRNYTLNGFYWTGVTGYRGSWLTAYNNGDYGIYAFDSVDGVFEHAYASGSPDSGFYIGQCYPCRAVVADVIAEYNGLGYSGTNSGGDLYVVESVFRRNKAGIGLTTFDIELYPPGRETTVVGNRVENNGDPAAAAFYAVLTVDGNGIIIAGGNRHRIERNLVRDNTNHGIYVMPLKDRNYWPATGNRVVDNVVLGNGRSDLAVTGIGSIGNCFAGNVYASAIPAALELLQGCRGPRLPVGAEPVSYLGTLGMLVQATRGALPFGDWRDRPVPPPQPVMPGGADAPVRPALHPFADYGIDADAIARPVSTIAAARAGR